MAKNATANANEPSEQDLKSALEKIEQRYVDLASERGSYMQKCKKIRETMADHYDEANLKGISKKLLKKIVKERDLERKIYALTDDLEFDEKAEWQMLTDKLGDFANSPLGQAAIKAAGDRAAAAASA